ncbi:unnamed protein product, partial [Rotaria magnacalcarata]
MKLSLDDANELQ